jgi:hypothetical protein
MLNAIAIRLPALLLLAIVCGEHALAQSDYPRPDIWSPNGTVHALAEKDNILYLGGSFNWVGPQVNSSAVWLEEASGNVIPTLKTLGPVYTLLPDGHGGWYLGGDFASVDGVSCARLAHILPNGTLNFQFRPNPNGSVRALLLDNGVLYAGGSFTQIDGQNRSYLAALDPTTGSIQAWSPGANSVVRCLAIAGSTIYAGGGFTRLGGQPRAGIGAVNRDTGLATGWNPTAVGGAVEVLAVQGDRIYAGGAFTGIGGEATSYLAALNEETGLATAWTAQANNTVLALALSGDTLYAGGAFTKIGDAVRAKVAALDTTTGLARTWTPWPVTDALESVRAIALLGETVYVARSTPGAGRAGPNQVLAVNISPEATILWETETDRSVFGIAAAAEGIAVGGAFHDVGGVTRNALAAIDLETGRPAPWNPSATGPYGASTVYALAIQGNTLYAGGDFTNIGSVFRSGLAAIDPQTGVPSPWNPGVDDVPYPYLCTHPEESQKDTCYAPYRYVSRILPAGDRIFVGGTFQSIDLNARNSMAAISTSTGDVMAWDPRLSNQPDFNGEEIGAHSYAMLINGDTLYTAGDFLHVNGFSRNGLAAIDVNSAALRIWNPAPNDPVYALASTGNKLYLGGRFTAIADRAQSGFLGLNLTTGAADSKFASEAGSIADLALMGDTLYLAGTNNGPLLKAINTRTGETTPWSPPFSYGSVETVTVNDAYVFAGGSFSVPGTSSRANLAVFPMGRNIPYVQSIVPSSSSTNGTTLTFHVRFSQPVEAFDDLNDLLIRHDGTAHQAVVINGDGMDYDVLISGLSGRGQISLSVRIDSGVTAVGGEPLGATLFSKPVRVGHQAPAVLSITPIAEAGSPSTRRFTVTFDDNMQNFNDDADLIVTHTGTTHGSTHIEGSGQVYTVTLSEVFGVGSFRVAVNTGSDIHDYWGYPLASSVESQNVYVDDRPFAISIVPDTIGPTDADRMAFAVRFDQPVQHFDTISDLRIGAFGISYTEASITGSGDTYEVLVQGLSGNGSLHVSVSETGGDVQNLRGMPLRQSVTSPSVYIRSSGPRILSMTPSDMPAELGTYPLTICFSEPVRGFERAAFQLIHNGTAASGVHVVGSGDTYTLSFIELTGRGILQVTVDPLSYGASYDGLPLVSGFTTNVYVNLPPEASEWGEQNYAVHSTDANGDQRISLSELLRCVQFFNIGTYACAAPGATEDGYLPGASGEHACRPHDADFEVRDWQISLHELLRIIQFYNSESYGLCPEADTEDGFCV